MKQIVQNMKDGQTEIVEVPIPKIKPGYLLVKTGASLVSAGTERMLVDFAEKNLIEKAQSRPDLFNQVIQKAQRDGVIPTIKSALNRLDQPIVLGYSSAGTIIEIGEGIKQFSVGDRVACAGGGYAVHAEYALVPKNLVCKLPDSVSFEEGAFATIGAIALNGIRLSQPQIGEFTAVIGLGLLGLLAAQMLKASGCRVVGMDLDPERIDLARELGIDAYKNDEVVNNHLKMTKGFGFDHIFICADTKSNQPVEISAEIARDRASVIAIGAVGMEIPRKQYYEKELTFKVSRSYGPGRYDPAYEEKGYDYPEGYIRWTEGRNICSVLSMIADQQLNVKPLITHRFPLDNATAAYQLLSGKTEEKYIGLVINYPTENDSQQTDNRVNLSGKHKKTDQTKLNIGIIGAGNYANAVFLPIIQKNPASIGVGIASTRGLHAQQAARKFRLNYATSDENAILDDREIEVAVILTQHDTHADLTGKALKKGKHVFCEKPLSIDRKGIASVQSLLEKENHPYLTVGFNRRFAPFIQEIQSRLKNNQEPIYAHYRINAGYLPPNHWLHNPQSGGGRLIGEACHFIDLMLYLVGAAPSHVSAQALPNSGKYQDDNLHITINFTDGSIASIAYLANGSRTAGKEYLEIFSGGYSIMMNDFRKLEIFGRSKKTKRALLKQDKGHTELWDAFIKAIRNHSEPPIPYRSLLQSSYTTLACAESLRLGDPIQLEKFISG